MSGRAAVATMVRNEPVFLPIWLEYYGRFFPPEDRYVLDHDSDDGSTDGSGFVRIPVSHPRVDWAWHRDALQAQQHALLQEYDTVLVTDVDEIVAPDPEVGDLGGYLAAFDRDFVTCAGTEVLHMRGTEPPFNPCRGVLEQRGWWFRNPAYSKPLLARVPMYWHGGMHSRTDGLAAPDERLFLIHLHRMDYDICLARHQKRVSIPWNERDVNEGWAYQNRIIDPEAFHRWFYEDSCSEVPVEPRAIAAKWRTVV
jgi:hypothetical protein